LTLTRQIVFPRIVETAKCTEPRSPKGEMKNKGRRALETIYAIFGNRASVIQMPMAYVLLNSEAFESQLAKALREIKGVEEVYPVYGVYDFVVRTRADTMDKLKETHDKIRKLNRVRSTLTMITHEG
jgi:DNA-binding Lrp family transcriptional regulator